MSYQGVDFDLENIVFNKCLLMGGEGEFKGFSPETTNSIMLSCNWGLCQ